MPYVWQDADEAKAARGQQGDSQPQSSWGCRCGFAKNFESRKKCWKCGLAKPRKKAPPAAGAPRTPTRSGTFASLVKEEAKKIQGASPDKDADMGVEVTEEGEKEAIRNQIAELDAIIKAVTTFQDPHCVTFREAKIAEQEGLKRKLVGMRPISTRIKTSKDQE